jgi:hypothetical protein
MKLLTTAPRFLRMAGVAAGSVFAFFAGFFLIRQMRRNRRSAGLAKAITPPGAPRGIYIMAAKTRVQALEQASGAAPRPARKSAEQSAPRYVRGRMNGTRGSRLHRQNQGQGHEPHDLADPRNWVPGRARVTQPPVELLRFHQLSQAPNLEKVMAPVHPMKSSPLVRRQRT